MKLSHALSGLWMAAAMTVTASSGAVASKVPLVCSHGPRGQTFGAVVTMPASVPPGSVFTVRIDGLPTGKISHEGVNYIHDMTVDYWLPEGVSYIARSVRIIPGTGSPNVRPEARAEVDATGLHMVLPAHVPNGDEFTAPSVQFQLMATAPVNSVLRLRLVRFMVTANAAIVGSVRATCDPVPNPYELASTRVEKGGP